MKKTTTMAVVHSPTNNAASAPMDMSVCEMTCRLRVARMTLRNIGAPPIRTSSTPMGKGMSCCKVIEQAQPFACNDENNDRAEGEPKGGE